MKKLLVSLMLVVILPIFSYAEDRFNAGTWELRIGSSSIDFSINPSIGYFFLDNVEGKVHFDYTKLELDYPAGFDDTETTSRSFEAGLVFNIPTNTNIVPFLVGGLGYYSIDEDVENSSTLDTSSDAVGFDAGFGLRFLIGDRASINTSIDYAVVDIDVDDTSVDLSGYDLTISYSLFFK